MTEQAQSSRSGRGTVVLVCHPGSQRDDRASLSLARRGFDLQWVCPGEGDRLPEARDEHIGAIVYGGPQSVNDLEASPYLRDEIEWTEKWVGWGKPFFGICLGGQILARAMGAPVAPHPEGLHEIGYVEVEPTAAGQDFMADRMSVYHWHNEGFTVPQSATKLVGGPVFQNQAFRAGEKVYGIQFHPEVSVPIISRWMSEAEAKLSNPGAQAAEKQLDDATRHDAPLEAWLERFLDRWTTSVEEASTQKASAGKANAGEAAA